MSNFSINQEQSPVSVKRTSLWRRALLPAAVMLALSAPAAMAQHNGNGNYGGQSSGYGDHGHGNGGQRGPGQSGGVWVGFRGNPHGGYDRGYGDHDGYGYRYGGGYGYAAVPVAQYWCEFPRGYYPRVEACRTGWRLVP